MKNVMAATAMSVNFGVPMEKIVEVLKRFQAVEHRIEYVTEKEGPFLQRFQGNQPGCRYSGNPCDEPSNASDRRRL